MLNSTKSAGAVALLTMISAWSGSLSAAGEDCQDRPYCIGAVIDDKTFAAWNIAIQPDGHNLPKGKGNAVQGAKLFQDKCDKCHGEDATKGRSRYPIFAPYPTLVSDKPLRKGYACVTGGEAKGPEQVIGSYWPYSTTVFDYIRRAMPFWHPQSLSDNQVYALSAYLLHRNKLWDKNEFLNRYNLASIKMPNSECFVCDPRPDTNNQRCMTNCLDQKYVPVSKAQLAKQSKNSDCMLPAVTLGVSGCPDCDK